MSRSTHEIERDVERTRSDIEDTVEALREKMSLGQIVDEASRYLRNSGGSEAMSNLATQAKANPMPLVLVGIGLAWLMSGRGQPAMGSYMGYGSYTGSGSYAGSHTGYSTGESTGNVGSRIGEAAGSAKGVVSGTSRKAGEAVSSGMHKAGDAAADAYGRVSGAASQTYERASQTYGRMSEHASETYDRMSDRAYRAQRSMSELIESEPLILAGLGIAVGAAIGAMMPATRTEQRFMGEKLDEIKHDASEMARTEWEKSKSVAKEAASAAKKEIEKGGSTSDTAERAAKSASQTAEQSARDKGLGSSVRKT